MAAKKSTTHSIETMEDTMATEVTATHLIVAVPLTRNADGKLELPESASGKTRQVATTHGNQNTGARINGAAVFCGVNAYVRND
jgi:hypothetical protein